MIRIKDGYYGSTTQNGTWNGIIGELHRHNIDLSIVDLSVTSERMQVIYIAFMKLKILVFLKILSFFSKLESIIVSV